MGMRTTASCKLSPGNARAPQYLGRNGGATAMIPTLPRWTESAPFSAARRRYVRLLTDVVAALRVHARQVFRHGRCRRRE